RCAGSWPTSAPPDGTGYRARSKLGSLASPEPCAVRFLPKPVRIAVDAFYAFLADDGWAIASHIALSALMALFPFLIVVTALAGFCGSKQLADEVATLMLETWPKEVAGPISREIHNVLTTTRGDVLTIGVVLAVYFASSGIESLRIGLNRAYNI